MSNDDRVAHIYDLCILSLSLFLSIYLSIYIYCFYIDIYMHTHLDTYTYLHTHTFRVHLPLELGDPTMMLTPHLCTQEYTCGRRLVTTRSMYPKVPCRRILHIHRSEKACQSMSVALMQIPYVLHSELFRPP